MVNLIENEKYELHPAVFYRTYGNNTIVYNTKDRKVCSFSGSFGAILSCFDRQVSAGDVLAELKIKNDICDFMKFLSGAGIIMKSFVQTREERSMEKEASEFLAGTGQLYSATIELTYRCNEKCRHCYVTGFDKPEMDLRQIKDVLDQLSEMQVMNVIFTGGEVFARQDAFEILEYAYSKHFVIDIFTNGTALDGNDYIRLKSIWPRSIQFSVYSHIPEKHDRITRVKGSFEKTLHSIRSCLAIGIPVNIKSPIFNETKDDIRGLTELAASLGATIELSSNITPRKDGDLTPLEMKVTDETDYAAIHRTIEERIPSAADIGRNKADSGRLCSAGDNSISISPYGEVYPCSLLMLNIGDVTKQSLKEIWEGSDTLKWWRSNNYRKLRKGCDACTMADQCMFCPGEAMMRNGNPLVKYSEACRATECVFHRQKEGGDTDGEKQN